MAPARTYIPELLPEVLSGAIQPGKVFDLRTAARGGRRGVRRDGRAPRDQGAAAAVARERDRELEAPEVPAEVAAEVATGVATDVA